MDLIEALKAEPKLADFIKSSCNDEGIEVQMEEGMEATSIIVIKVDDFYNSLRQEKTPASIDCLIVQHCGNDNYRLYLVELKNVKTAHSINNQNLEEKFETTLLDFLSNKFRTYFFDEKYKLKLKLILSAGKVKNDFIKSYQLEFLLGLRLFRFQNTILSINGIPPHPIIKKCLKE
jgi:hypothetical protein